MFELKLESGSRRIYETASGTLAVEICNTDHRSVKGGAMDVYVKNGWVDRFMDETIGCQTYFKLPDGAKVGELFNPTVKRVAAGSELDFEWLLEATAENESRLLGEIGRRYAEWVKELCADVGLLGERGQ